MMFNLYIITAFFAVLIGAFLLQYFLSTREAGWPGLILPALSVLLGLVYALAATTLSAALTAFLIAGGLPCVLHLALYKLGRSRWEKKSRDRIDKMNIQDL